MTTTETATTIGVAFVRRAADIPDSLWRACFPIPLEGRFWYTALEQSRLEDQFDFRYAILSEAGAPIGIAPCFVHDVPIGLVAPPAVAFVLRQLARWRPQVGFQRTFFVGSPCSDEGTIGLAPGRSLAEVLPPLRRAVLAAARESGARMTVFKDFRAEDARDLAASDSAEEFVSTLSYPGTIAHLVGDAKADFYRAMPHRRRHHLQKKLRRSQEQLPLEVAVLTEPPERELAAIHGLFWQTYQRGKTKFERLGPEFFAAMARAREAQFLVLRQPETKELFAFMLLFQLGPRVINKFIGIDYARGSQAFLYFRLFDAALDFAYAAGARELQSGQTGYRAKLDYGHTLVPLHNVFHHDSRPIHWLFRTIGRRITWASLDPDLRERKPACA